MLLGLIGCFISTTVFEKNQEVIRNGEKPEDVFYWGTLHCITQSFWHDGTTISDNVDRGHTQWFMQKIADLFVSDYYNQKLHEIYFNDFKINSLKIEQTFIITKDTNQTISINNNRLMLLAKLGDEYNNQIILVSELPKY